MNIPLSTYLPLTVLLSAGFGLVVHDTRVDSAIVNAMSTPALVVEVRTEPERLISELHIHSDIPVLGTNLNLRSQQPSAQPKNEDDRKYIAQKGQKYNAFGSEYIWPSI